MVEGPASLFVFLAVRENIDPNMALSGLSEREVDILPVIDLPDALRDKLGVSVPDDPESRERKDDDVEEKVFDLEPCPNMDPLFISSV